MKEKESLRFFETVDLKCGRCGSVMTVSAKCVKFNGETARELGFAAWVRALIHVPSGRLAIEPCEEGEPNAFRFCADNAAGRGDVILKVPALLAAAKKLMGHGDVCGELAFKGTLYYEDQTIIYDLTKEENAVEGKTAEDVRSRAEREARGITESERAAAATASTPRLSEVTEAGTVQKARRGRPRKVAWPVPQERPYVPETSNVTPSGMTGLTRRETTEECV